jgi:hypothetical protein
MIDNPDPKDNRNQDDDFDFEKDPFQFEVELSDAEKYAPHTVLMQDFHAQVQLYCRVSIVAGIILGIATLICGIGLAFLGLAIGAYGIFERKKWGLTWARASLWCILATSGLVSVALLDDDPMEIVLYLPQLLRFSLAAISIPIEIFSLVGLIVLYSKKMKFYIN